MGQERIEVLFKMEKKIKNFVRFDDPFSELENGKFEPMMTGSLYIREDILESIGWHEGTDLKVTIEAD